MRTLRIGVAVLACMLSVATANAQTRYGVGRVAMPAEIAAWNIDIGRDGANLPPGRGTVARGRQVYDVQCSACHGAHGEGGVGDRLAGGQGTLGTAAPVKTVGSYWPYATTLFDYIRRAMPLTAPQSLSNDDVYAVSAYVLHLNSLLPAEAALDAKTLPTIRMPNRDMFRRDPRPDIRDAPCTKDC